MLKFIVNIFILFYTFAHHICIYLFKNTVKSNIVKYYYNLKYLFSILIF